MQKSKLQNLPRMYEVGQQLQRVTTSNDFPLDAFPSDIQDIILNLKQKQSFPIDFTGSSLLFAASVAAGNGFYVRRPFFQTPLIYLVLVANSGQVKSHPLSFATQPFVEMDKQNFDHYKAEKEAYEADDTGEMAEPVWKQNIVRDSTPEALYRIHMANKLGLGHHVDEFAALFESFDRYNNGSDRSFWLSLWSQQPISKNRVKSEDQFIAQPFISIAGTLQTPLLNKLASNNLLESGFLDRILFTFPSGLKAARWSDQPRIEDEKGQWHQIIKHIREEAETNIAYDSAPMEFHEEAFRELKDWQRRNASAIDEANDNGDHLKAQMLAKLDVYAVRLSILMSVLYDPESQEITKRHVNSALSLVEYFRQCGQKVRDRISEEEPADTKTVIKYLTDQGKSHSQIAQMLGVGKGYVSKVINGKK
jgi:hypothetical protein